MKLTHVYSKDRHRVLVFIAVISLICLLIVNFVSASTRGVSFEAETSTNLSTCTNVINSSSASSSQALEFDCTDLGTDGYIEGWGNPVWRDEFDYINPSTGLPAIDPSKWNVRQRAGDLGLLPDASVVEKTQVFVQDGKAVLRAEWLDEPVVTTTGPTGNPTNRWHKTGYMDHRWLKAGDISYQQQYGRWEIRAKVPTGPNTLGSLAAFWLRNSLSGEIDIMEAWGFAGNPPTTTGQVPGSSTMTFHSHTSGSSASGYQKFFWRVDEQLKNYSNMNWSYLSNNIPITPAYNDFRTWAFEYTPTYLAGFYEGQEFGRTTPAQTPWLWNSEYFGAPFHVRLNLHVGISTQYWGLPNPNNKHWTQDPMDFVVDYVRIYEYQAD